MSVFAQPVPYTFAAGDWNSRREEVARVALGSIGRFCSNIPEAVLHRQVMGPREIERRTGLTGGHIFQGECLPEYMWDRRLTPSTPMEGVYLCGAGTYPGGSVVGINGRNAAMEVLRKTENGEGNWARSSFVGPKSSHRTVACGFIRRCCFTSVGSSLFHHLPCPGSRLS